MHRRDFHYDLPKELIAQEPRPRGASRMMVVRPGDPAQLEHRTFDAFPTLLKAGDLLVLNDTEVFPARLFSRPKGQMKKGIELLLTRRTGPWRWVAMCRPAKRVRAGETLWFSDELSCTIEEKNEDGTIGVAFSASDRESSAENEAAFWSLIDQVGVTPLPPYIQREQQREGDRAAYQTVYAKHRGAVAAPTAGLHFTTEILDQVRAAGVEVLRLTLHVGVGTFKPVTAELIADHRMEQEIYDISPSVAEALNRALEEKRRIVAVGTTSVRALESAARLGNGSIEAGEGRTSLFITPGYRFRVVDALLTNFHLPESTLLMLVSAFAGTELIRHAYEEAVRRKYLFYSFGDCMFLTSRKPEGAL